MKLGRISRGTYQLWFFIIITINIFIYFFAIFDKTYHSELELRNNIILFLTLNFVVAFILAGGRLNDLNKSAWFALLLLVPFINFSSLLLLFLDGTKGENDYGQDPKGRTSDTKTKLKPSSKKVEHEVNESQITDLSKKLDLLQNSLDEGILNEDEYNSKKQTLISEIDKLNTINQSNDEYEQKRDKLLQLLENDIITKTEYQTKLKALAESLNISGWEFEHVTLDTLFYYIQGAQQFGPFKVKSIMKFVKNNELNPACWIREKDSELMEYRVRDLLAHFEEN